jgi:hypothetical protein
MVRVFASGLLFLGLSLISESSFAQQTGCVFGDCVNGKGTLYYSDGSRYEGGWVQSGFDGEGALYFADGSVDKQGIWKNGYLLQSMALITLDMLWFRVCRRSSRQLYLG